MIAHFQNETVLHPYDPDADGDSDVYAAHSDVAPEIPEDLTEDDITECTRVGIGPELTLVPTHMDDDSFTAIAPVLSLSSEFINPEDIVDETDLCLHVSASSRTEGAKKKLFAHFKIIARGHVWDILEYDNVRPEVLRLRQLSRARGYDPADTVLELKKQGMSLPMACVLVSLAMGGDA